MIRCLALDLLSLGEFGLLRRSADFAFFDIFGNFHLQNLLPQNEYKHKKHEKSTEKKQSGN